MDNSLEITRLQDRIDALEDAVRTAERERDDARNKCEDLDNAMNEIYDIARKNT